MDEMAEIRTIFFQECEEQLSELENGLLALDEGRGGTDTVNAIFRAVHSVKGGAGAFGLDELVRFAHVFETTLEAMRSGRLGTGSNVIAVMMHGADMLSDMVRASAEGSAADIDFHHVAEELASLLGGPVAAVAAVDAQPDFVPVRIFEPPATTPWQVRFAPSASLYANGSEAGLLLRELTRLGPALVTLDTSQLPDLASLDPDLGLLAWNIELETACTEDQIREVFDFVDGECELSIQSADATPQGAPVVEATASPSISDTDLLALMMQVSDIPDPPPEAAQVLDAGIASPATAAQVLDAGSASQSAAAAQPAQSTIRVDLDRVDRLIDLVGELVINEAMLSQRVIASTAARSTETTSALDALRQLTREIQDSVMAIRAQPVRSIFQRMPRLVREVAATTGKSVRLVMAGENTEVDKTVIERLADPLTHMIRNAIDHGLEPTEVRRAGGKPDEGLVRLSALHRSGRIVIELSDDGAGINRARVKAKAIEKGLIPDEPLTDEEVDNLIFLPGFSTAEAVTDLSGRGVGMDVVRRSVQALGGRISVSSQPGKGSTFTLSLPLTLAVLDGMVVTVEEQTLLVPLSAILETLQPKQAVLHDLAEGVQVVAIRGSYVPMIDVGMALGFRTTPLPAESGVAILVESEGGRRTVLLVDGIAGQRQVVIKSLEINYGPVPGIAAATVMGDGRVALILDVDVIACGDRHAEAGTQDFSRRTAALELV